MRRIDNDCPGMNDILDIENQILTNNLSNVGLAPMNANNIIIMIT